MIRDILMFLVGLGILSWGADLFVGGASRIALNLKVSPMLIGATVVAFGSSAPELFVGLQAATGGQPDIVLGNIVGSNLCNIGLALGLYAVIRPFAMTGRFRDKEFVFFVLTALALLVVVRDDATMTKNEGAFFVAGLVLFLILCIREGRRSRREEQFVEQELLDLDREAVAGHSPWTGSLLRLAAGLAGLHYGSEFLIEAAVNIGRTLEMSEAVIGLFLVAVGTSLPEIAISVMAAIRGEEGLALGNILGSNSFNVLCVGGICAMVEPISTTRQMVDWDIPIMIGFTLVFLMMLRADRRLNRVEGGILVAAYVIYSVLRLAGPATPVALP